MAANKKSSTTSKTAHVMNLLSKNRETLSPDTFSADNCTVEASAAEKIDNSQAKSTTAPPISPIIASFAPDAAISSEIKDALEAALEDELKQQTPELASAQAEVSAPSTLDTTSQENISNQTSMADKSVASTDDKLLAADVTPQAAIDKTTYVNIMQVLVEENAEKYIKMFGLCQCRRCLIDVKALALNNLPPKYVVMHQGEMVPRITVYEGQFKAAVTAQLLRACKIVMENPRHDM